MQAEIEAERVAAEERERELASKQKAEAEATEAQRKKDAEVAAAEKEKKRIEYNCRLILCENTNEDGEFEWLAKKPEHVLLVSEYLTTTYPDMFAVTHGSESVLQGTVSSSLLEALKTDPIAFRETGKMETAELAADLVHA